MGKVRNISIDKELLNVLIGVVQVPKVVFQLVDKEAERPVARVEFDGVLDVLPLSVRIAVALSVKITFATLSVLHGVVKHAIFAGVYR